MLWVLELNFEVVSFIGWGMKDKEADTMLLHLLLLLSLLSSFIENGSAGMTSAFIRSEWPSVDIPLDNKAFEVPKGHNSPQQVSLWLLIVGQFCTFTKPYAMHISMNFDY